MKKLLSFLLSAVLILSLSGCSGKTPAKTYKPVSGLDTEKNVTLTIAIPYETNKALNTVANAFMNKYQNVSISLLYVEDYDTNAVKLFKENSVDMILQKDITYSEYTEKDEETGDSVPTGKTTEDYYYDFASDEEIDFSGTTPDITNNYRHTRKDDSGNEITYQYCYPLGGETRGVFVNKTLLTAYGLSVPKNYTEFVNCCETLKEKGLVPIQGGPDTMAYGLGMASAANGIVHDEEALLAMSKAESGISERFRDTLEKIYNLSTNRYADYKKLEENGTMTSSNELGQSKCFLGLITDKDTFEVTKPENNYGYCAFLPYISSTETVIRDLIDEYSLDTEVEFICSPLNDEGSNSPVYITPHFGICANKNSENLIWIREFVNFLFTEENIKKYATEASIIPNTTDAFSFVAEKYNVDTEKDVALCGQIYFSDSYNGYSPISVGLKNVMKCNAQKYMVNLNKDENGNIGYETDEDGKEFLYMNEETKIYKEYVGAEDPEKPGYAFCTLDYYLKLLEEEFAKYRVG